MAFVSSERELFAASRSLLFLFMLASLPAEWRRVFCCSFGLLGLQTYELLKQLSEPVECCLVDRWPQKMQLFLALMADLSSRSSVRRSEHARVSATTYSSRTLDTHYSITHLSPSGVHVSLLTVRLWVRFLVIPQFWKWIHPPREDNGISTWLRNSESD